MKQFHTSPKSLLSRAGLAMLAAGLVLSVAGLQGCSSKSGGVPSAGSDTAKKNFFIGIKEVNADQIHQLFPGTEGKPLFIEFKSKFCLACKKMDPILETVLPEFPNVEKRVFDMMKDKESNPQVFSAFQPVVVPVQVYVDDKGKIVNVFYDFHTKEELTAALKAIDVAQENQKKAETPEEEHP